MKRKGTRLSLILGLLLLVVLLGAGYLFLVYGRQPQGQAGVAGTVFPATPVPKVRVVMAKQAIPADTVLTAEMIDQYFDVQDFPRDQVPCDLCISSKVQLIDTVTRVELKPGDFLEMGQFIPVTLSFKIPEGKRAVPLKVDQFSGVVGRVAANDTVDIVFSGQIELHFPEAFPPPVEGFISLSPASLLAVKTILQDIEILEVIPISPTVSAQAQKAQPTPQAKTEEQAAPGAPKPTEWILILAMNDQEAEVLKFALDSNMTFQLLLRPRGDHALGTTTGLTTRILIDKYGVPIPEYIPYEINPRAVPTGSIP